MYCLDSNGDSRNRFVWGHSCKMRSKANAGEVRLLFCIIPGFGAAQALTWFPFTSIYAREILAYFKRQKIPKSYTCWVTKVGLKLSYGRNYFCLCLEATTVSRAHDTGWVVDIHAELVAGLSQLPGGGFTAGSWNAEVAKAVWSRARNWTLILGGWVAVMNMGDRQFLIWMVCVCFQKILGELL